jgi:hypothetical protein
MGTSILFILIGMVFIGLMFGGTIAKVMSLAGKDVNHMIVSGTKE